jgi:hypothetical protein
MEVNAIISINTDEIEEGTNPDGSPFNTNSIITPSIINKAIIGTDLVLTATVDDIRENIRITPIIPSYIEEQRKLAQEKGEEFSYYPSEFKIVFGFSGLLTEKDAKKVIDNIIDIYHQDFIEKYASQEKVENLLSGTDIERYDYKELSDLIDKQLIATNTFLTSKIDDTENYRSRILGYSFYDMQQSLEIIKQNDFGILESLIERFNLSKNIDNLITLYNYQIKTMELDLKKSEAEAQSTINLMQNYDQKKSVVMVPGVDNQEFKANEMVSYYDKLAERAATSSVLASDTFYDIEYKKFLIASLENDSISNTVKEDLEKESEQVIKKINTKTNQLINKINKLSAEHRDYIMDNAISMTSTSQIKINANIKMNLAIALVISLILGAFISFFKEYWKNSNKEATE